MGQTSRYLSLEVGSGMGTAETPTDLAAGGPGSAQGCSGTLPAPSREVML